jgi:undecaprenyl-diphosphatase
MLEVLRDLLEVVLLLDERAVAFVLAIRSPLLTKVLTSVTGMGSAAAGAVFLGLLWLADWDEEFRQTLVALAVCGAVVGVLMSTIQRPFPPQPVCLTDGGETVATSFPSGHAAAVAAYATVARDSEVFPFGPTALLAAAIAFSRIYLGTHYLSDTVVGVLIGVGAALLAKRLLADERVRAALE